MATVLPLRDLSSLFDVMVSPEAPQVHVHLLTPEAELADGADGRFELCCHGCGESVLVRVESRLAGDPALARLRDDFERAHRTCPQFGAHPACGLYRSRTDVLDLTGT